MVQEEDAHTPNFQFASENFHFRFPLPSTHTTLVHKQRNNVHAWYTWF